MQIINDVFNDIFGLDFMDNFHSYDDEFGNIRYYHRLKARLCTEFIDKNSGQDKVIMDAGAGRGPYSFFSINKYKLIYCFEYDDKELSIAKDNIGINNQVILQRVDLTSIPLPDKCVDVIVCSEVLEHITDNTKAMAEMTRVLKNDGVILLSMPNRDSLFYRKVRIKNKQLLNKDPQQMSQSEWEVWRHLQFAPKDIERLATSSGLVIKQRRGVNLLPLPYKLRKFLLARSPKVFRLFLFLQKRFSRLLPMYCSFYFLELKKPAF